GQFDPSAGDTTAGFTYSYDFNNDGDFTDGGDVADSSSDSASIPAALLADGPASFTVRGRIADRNDDYTDYTTVVSVLNVKPTVVLSGDDTTNEGQTKTYTYTVTDPGVDTYTAVESCGGNGDYTDTAAADSFTCFFPDGPASTDVTVKVTDSDGLSDTD